MQAESFTWVAPGSGTWEVNENWLPATGYPDAPADVANFWNVPASLAVITAGGAINLSKIEFYSTNLNSCEIAGGPFHIYDNITAYGDNKIISGDIVLMEDVIIFHRNAFTLSGDISGEFHIDISSLTELSSPVITLAGSNTYTGATINRSSELRLSGSGTLGNHSDLTLGAIASFVIASGAGTKNIGTLSGSGFVNLNNNTLVVNQDADTTFSGIISGTGVLEKAGASQLSLTAVNTYSGGTTLSGGTLKINADSNLGNSAGGVTFNDNSAVLSSSSTFSSARSMSMGTNGTIHIEGGTVTWGGVVSNTGALTKSGTGTLALAGTNTYSGGTTITNGTISIGADAGLGNAAGTLTFSGLGVTLNSTATFSSARDMTLSSAGTMNIDDATTLTLSGVLSGAGALTKSGSGTLVLSGANTYSGGTTISAGAVQIGANAGLGNSAGSITFDGGALNTTATFSASRAITISSTGSVNIDDATTLTLLGVISSTGSLTKSGEGTLVLSGTNTYSGGTTISAGTVRIGANAGLGNGAGSITFDGGALNTIATFSISRAIQLLSSGTINTNNETTLPLYGVISGMGSLTKTGAGTLILGGTNTYSGGTTVSAGTLQGDVTSLQGDIIDNAAVIFDQGSVGTYAGVISGTGSVAKSGAGTLILSGANTYSGGTTVSAGKLQGNTASLQGDILNDATVVFNQENAGEYAGVISGTGSVAKLGMGTLVLSGANTYSGGTTISAGTVQIGANAGLGNSAGSITFDGGALNTTATFSTSRAITISSTGSVNIDDATTLTLLGVISSTGSLTKSGTGTLILGGTNTYSGGTTISAGTLAGTPLSLRGNIVNNGTVAFSGNGEYAGNMSGTGNVSYSENGLLTLSGTNTYSGGTTVSVGTLAGTPLSLQGDIVNNGTVAFSGNGEYAGNISGTGLVSVVEGKVTFTGTNTYSGDTLVYSGGTLQGNTNSLQGDIVNNATVVFNQEDAGEYTGAISGAGSVAKLGIGTLVLSGTNTYSGGTTVSVGTLAGTPLSLQGDIVNNGTVAFSGDGEYAGDMSGTGNVSYFEDDLLTLSGTNTYSGGTTVSAGTLAGTPLSLQGDIVNNGTVAFSGNGEYAGNMSGTGSVSYLEGDLLTLSGINTYSGGTTISAGTLAGTPLSLQGDIVNNGTVAFSGNGEYAGNMGGTGNVSVAVVEGKVTFTGTNTYSGGTLVCGGGILQGTTNSLQGNITNSAAVVFDQGSAGEYAGIISDTGSVTKSGVGTLILSGINTCTGGITINGGSIELSGSGTLGNGNALSIISGSLVIASDAGTRTIGNLSGGGSGINLNNNELIITQSSGATFSGVISGTGGITKVGESQLILTGVNTYSGGTAVSAGILRGDAESLQGDILNDATVVFNQENAGEYAGVISGAGEVAKTGSGKLIMSGANTCGGGTVIYAGELQVTGVIEVGPLVVFGEGAILSGTGTLSVVANHGIVSPGLSKGTVGSGVSIGKLTINHHYVQQSPEATLSIEIDSIGHSDLLDIGGAAILGGRFQINPESGFYPAGTRYTFLTVGDFIQGEFDLLIEGPLAYAIDYDSNSNSNSKSLTLVILESGSVLPVPMVRLHGNEKKIAEYLFGGHLTYTGDLLTVIQSITQVSAGEFPDDLDQLGPAQFGALPLVSLQSDTRIATTFAEYAEKHARCQTQQELVFWAEPIGYYYKESGQGQIPFHARTFGTSFGGSKMFTNDLVFSGGGAYTHSKLRWKENAGTANWDTIYVCPSLGWVPRNFYINGLALFAFNFYDVDRNISFPNVRRTAANTHAGMDVLVRGDAGGKFRVTKNGFFLQPEFRLSYLNVFENGYVETGAKSINLEIEKEHTAFIQPQCTLKWIKEWRKEATCFSPSLYIGWLRNAPLTDGFYTSQFFGQTMHHPNFTVQSFHKMTDQLILGSELLISTPKVLFVFEYEANIGYSYQVQEGKVRFNWAF